MTYIAINPKSYMMRSVGNGQCVAFVREASNAPHSSAWTRGAQVKSANFIGAGTAISTFDSNGRYGSRMDGTSHVAIFLSKSAIGIVVLDQWITKGKPQPVHQRTIRFNNDVGKKINNGDEYYVVE